MADHPARVAASGKGLDVVPASRARARAVAVGIVVAAACVYAACMFAIPADAGAGRLVGSAIALAAAVSAWAAWRTRPRAGLIALLCGAGALLAAAIGLVAGLPQLAGIAADQTPLSPEGLACMALLLAGGMALEGDRPRLAALLFTAAALPAAATMAAWLHVPPRSAPPSEFALDWWLAQRMQPLHALAPLAAAGAGLLASVHRDSSQGAMAAWLIGLGTLLAALVSLVASTVGVREATAHLSYPAAAVPSALALAGVSMWLVLRDRALRPGAAWLPLLAALALTGGAMRLAWFIEAERSAQRQREAEAAAAEAERAIQRTFAARLSSIDRFAERLLAVSPPERVRLFDVEAQQALRASLGMQSVARVDAQRIVRQIATLNLTTRLVGRSAVFDENRARAYERAERTGEAVALGPLLLAGTEIEAMLVIYPGPFGESGTEFLVASYRLADMLALALDGVAPGFALAATIEGQPRSLRGTITGHDASHGAATRRFDALDANWTVTAAPEARRAGEALPASRAIVGAGMLVGLLVALALRLAATARERAAVAERAFAALRSESAARASSEAALARSQQQAQRLLEGMSDAVLTLDRDFRIVFANRQAKEMIGDRVGDPVGRTMAELFGNFPGSAFERGFRRAMADRRSVTMEGHSSTLGRWLSARVHPVDDGVTAIFDDVTEVRRAEAFEREQRDLLRAIASGLPVDECIAGAIRLFESRFPGAAAAVLRLDPATRRVDAAVAPSVPEDLFRSLLGSPLPPDAGCCGEAAAGGGSAYMLPIEGDPRAAGMAGPLLAAGFRACWSQAILDARGAVIGTFASYLREARRALPEETAAAQSVAALAGIAIERDLAALRVEIERQRFRSLSERSPYMVYAFDVDRRMVDCNGNVEREGGFTRAELLGIEAEALVLKPFRAAVRRHFDAALRGESTRFDCAVMTAAGARRDVEATLVPIAVDGRITGVFGVVRDITEERRMAADLDRALRDLTARNRELQDFAYVASHDLQEPLRKVQAFSDRVIQRYADQLDPRGVDYLRRVDAAAHRMQVLIDDLLAYSRVASRAQPFTPVPMGEVLADVLSDLEVRIDDTGARIDAVGPMPVLLGDRTQLRQLLQNLLANALKFRAPDRRPVVRVTAERADDGAAAVLSVEDNGIGFDPVYAERIFAPFQRLHGRQEYEGTGIGLAVVRRIVERHHGSVHAIGRPGQGARFEVTLPLAAG